MRMGTLVVSLVLVLTACSGGEETSPTSPPPSASDTPESEPPATAAPTTTVQATTTTLEVGSAGDIATCVMFFDAIGDFASSGSRQWVTEDGASISVSPLEWWGHQGDLNDAVTQMMTEADNATLGSLLVDASNAMQDDLNAEVDDPNDSVFPTAVFAAVKEIDNLSRSIEEHCHLLGSEVDGFHPLAAGNKGGSEDS